MPTTQPKSTQPKSTQPKSTRSSRLRSDEKYARSLQEQYRREFVQRQARKDAQARASAPVEPTNIETFGHDFNGERSTTAAAAAYAPSATTGSVNSTTRSQPRTANLDDAYVGQSHNLAMEAALMELEASSLHKPTTPSVIWTSPQEDEDAEFALHLHEEELERYNQNMANSQNDSANFHIAMDYVKDRPRSGNSAAGTFPTSSASSTSEDSIIATMAARRIAQEMDDAELAQRLALYEQEAHNRRQLAAAQHLSWGANEPQSKTRIFCQIVLPLICVAVAVAVILMFLFGGFEPGNVPLVGDFFGDDWVDPFEGSGGYGGDVDLGDETVSGIPDPYSDDAIKWANNGRGITLEIMNAMDDSWQEHLNTAIQNWDNGNPVDSLTLKITRIEHEVDCVPVDGRLKVCNGNYGDNRWRGLNELMVDQRTNVIVQSTAKMNEYYLSGESDDQQLYTLCHELGHGFGLPHWDENFFNEDSGNCMDYTDDPGSNKWPDASNFFYLAVVYGGVNVSTGAYVTQSELAAYASELEDTDGDRRRMGSIRGAPEFYEDVSMEMETLLTSKIELPQDEQPNRRRILKANERFEIHRILQDNEDHVKLEYYVLS